MSASSAVAALKIQMRRSAVVRRAEAFERHGAAAGTAIADHGLAFAGLDGPKIVSGFSSIRDEIAVAPLLERLHSEGHALALPVMQGKGQPLLFRAWSPGDEMAEAVWGISEPLPSRPVVEPDIVLVPLLAVDRNGYRLGYGGGFYDRTLAALFPRKQVIAVGIGYDEQVVDAVPYAEYDQRLHWILTPSGPFRCAGPTIE